MTIQGSDIARRQIAAGLIANGIPAKEAQLTADVTVHAAEEAIAALRRVTNTLDGRAWLNAYGLALQSTMSLMTVLHDEVREQAGEFGMKGQLINVDTRQ